MLGMTEELVYKHMALGKVRDQNKVKHLDFTFIVAIGMGCFNGGIRIIVGDRLRMY